MNHLREAGVEAGIGKRQAHSKVVEMVLNGSKPEEKPAISAIGS
jgi:peptidyl-tRNA hydrolase